MLATRPNPCRKSQGNSVKVARTKQAQPGRMNTMKKDRRWMKSIIAASTEVQVSLPWARGTRRRPAAMKAAPKAGTRAVAAS